MKTIAELIDLFKVEGDFRAVKVKEPEKKEYTFNQLFDEVMKVSSYLVSIGVKNGTKVAIFSDNRIEWLLSDLGCQYIGAIDVPRGSNISEGEIEYILNHSEINYIIIENKYIYEKIKNLKNKIPVVKKLIIIDEIENIDNSFDYIYFKDLLNFSEQNLQKYLPQINDCREKVKPEDLATIIYTSGTTGVPKGVMLTHYNIASDVIRLPDYIGVEKGDSALAILPTWHVYERTVEYIILYSKASIIYSKPFPSILLRDLEEENPQFLPSVPRVWEGVYEGILKNLMKKGKITFALFKFFYFFTKLRYYAYASFKGWVPIFSYKDEYLRKVKIPFNIIAYILLTPFYFLGNILIFKKIKAKLGKRFKAGVSGGGGLPRIVDDFFNGIGITLLEGYGLTETAPVVTVRHVKHPVMHTIGDLIPDVDIQIRDPENNVLGFGEKGIIWIKGPIVMKGYYKMEDKTKEVMDGEWFNSGDIGMMDINKRVKITGRAKNTIVLRGGENIEPEPIEEKLKESIFIKNVVVLGQDKRRLGALIIPDIDNLTKHFNVTVDEKFNLTEFLSRQEVINFYRDLIANTINIKNGFKRYEIIGNFKFIEKDFEAGVELTHTLKVKRNVVEEKYRKLIEELFVND
ncbi:MAG: AMP-binding protein [Spirochaetes bacterium]|nr:AMP-binding protein [Spirochaetota bacterium]